MRLSTLVLLGYSLYFTTALTSIHYYEKLKNKLKPE